IMLGHDTDTNAAIAGALLGAVYGFSQMPEPWVQVLDHCRPAPEPGCFRPRAPIYWPANAQEFLKQLGILPPV
ncbi:MAG: ADP-ribosylglycohydrolase family protein, partial [Sulfobacillus thermotolerans]|nr:ADP-ribosylglycohydrolase family protein [Sulfobacillus thermotolerans]